MGEGAGASYVPVPSLKSRPLNPTNLQALQTLTGSGTSPGNGIAASGTGITSSEEDWRRHPESWDREHRRYRPNTTRVQRKYIIIIHINYYVNFWMQI